MGKVRSFARDDEWKALFQCSPVVPDIIFGSTSTESQLYAANELLIDIQIVITYSNIRFTPQNKVYFDHMSVGVHNCWVSEETEKIFPAVKYIVRHMNHKAIVGSIMLQRRVAMEACRSKYNPNPLCNYYSQFATGVDSLSLEYNLSPPM